MAVQFKPIFPATYPRQQVQGPLQVHLLPQPDLYVSGRGIPDISTQAFGFQIFVGGKRKRFTAQAVRHIYVVAGIILNDFQISDNLYTLCFLNPWLYGPAARLLDDVQNRTNPGCNISGLSHSVAGWDPVTGLGTLVGVVFSGLVESGPELTLKKEERGSLDSAHCQSDCVARRAARGTNLTVLYSNGQNVGFPLLTPSSSPTTPLRRAKESGFNRINDDLPRDLKTRRPRRYHVSITDTDYNARSLREQNLTQIPNGTHVYSAVVDVDQLDSMTLVTEKRVDALERAKESPSEHSGMDTRDDCKGLVKVLTGFHERIHVSAVAVTVMMQLRYEAIRNFDLTTRQCPLWVTSHKPTSYIFLS
ncbi:hypothetical protein EDB89DRAFT_1907999 [Lactarius sanguifluus]|nr:hypothetical protein EDB89DRAFT_1907999 [Lactarius sanguifluus]